MELSHIDHVNVVVRDLGTATQFFVELGFEVRAERTLQGEWIDAVVGLEGVRARFVALELPFGQTVLELLTYDEPEGEADPNLGEANQIGYRHIAFAVTDIDAWHQKLEAMGVECLSDVEVVPNYRDKRIFYFRGPENILLELAEYPARAS